MTDALAVGVRLDADGRAGVLTADRELASGALAPGTAWPHIALVLRERLAGPGVTAAAALAAVGSVLGGVEVDGYFVTGPVAVAPDGLDLSLEACLVEVDGEITDSATGAAASGHPGRALALAANELGRRGQAIEPGWVVLTGGLTAGVPVAAGTSLAVHFTHLGSIFLAGALGG